MEKWEPVAEEYKTVFENYKITFDHAASLTKYYSYLVILILGGFSARLLTGSGISIIEKLMGWVMCILIMIFTLGVICLIVMHRITKARESCIRRMNYLRKKLLQDVDDFDFNEYIQICGFEQPILRPNWSALSHSIFLLSLTLFTLATILWLILRYQTLF